MRIYGRAFEADMRGRGVLRSARPKPGLESRSLTVPRFGYQIETYVPPAFRRRLLASAPPARRSR